MSNKNDSDMTVAVALFALFGAIALFVGVFAYMVWASALVGSILWAWFAAPFVGFTLTKAQAWGIALLVSFWTFHYKSVPIKDEREWKERVGEIIGLFCYPWLVLLFGWICHSWFWTAPILK